MSRAGSTIRSLSEEAEIPGPGQIGAGKGTADNGARNVVPGAEGSVCLLQYEPTSAPVQPYPLPVNDIQSWRGNVSLGFEKRGAKCDVGTGLVVIMHFHGQHVIPGDEVGQRVARDRELIRARGIPVARETACQRDMGNRSWIHAQTEDLASIEVEHGAVIDITGKQQGSAGSALGLSEVSAKVIGRVGQSIVVWVCRHLGVLRFDCGIWTGGSNVNPEERRAGIGPGGIIVAW